MSYENSETTFFNCCSRLKELKIADVNTVNNLIDELNTLNFPHLCINTRDIEDMLCHVILLVPKENDHLLTKLCSLIYLLFNKQERSISKESTQTLTEFFISSLQNCGECFLSDVLVGFAALLSINGDKIEKFHPHLLGENGILFDLIEADKHEKNVQYSAFVCTLNLLSKSPEKFIEKEYFGLCYPKFIDIIKKGIEQNASDVLSLKILMNSIKCLQCLFIPKHSLCDNLGELLGILKCLMFYGLPGPSLNDYVLQPTLPALEVKHIEDSQNESDSVAYPKLRKQKRVRRTKQKKSQQTKGQREGNENMNSHYDDSSGIQSSSPSTNRSFNDIRVKSSSSDSEYSDVESCFSKIKSHQGSVRQLAYQVLQCVVKNTDKKIIYGYWSSFLPDHPAIPGIAYGPNIFTTILKDPNSQVRLSSLLLLTEMLRGSKNFLSVADGRSTQHTSFTSLSSIVATIINEIHRCLLLALLSESSSLLLTQILKCYAILCENTPYCKLTDEILLKLLKNIKGFMHHKDAQVQVASLIVFQFIIKSDQVPENLGNVMISPDFDLAINNFCQAGKNKSLDCYESDIPWLVYVCQKNIFSDEPIAVRIESVQLLSCIVGKYFHKIYSTLPILEEIILCCLNHVDSSLQLHGTKLLDVFGRCIMNSTESKMIEEQNLQVKKLWQNVVNGPLIANITSEDNKSLLAVCCDCLSTLPADVFESLSPKQQIFYITVLLGLTSDSHANVRGAAVRCLGVYCLFPSLSQDFSFLCDVSEILVKCVHDQFSTVRFKASWSLGKLSDALFENNVLSIQDLISEHFFYSTAMACLQYSKDCDKVRANSVRALGIFLYHLPNKWMESPKIRNFVKSASSILQSALTSSAMKVCWNVCYAFGKILKNSDLITNSLIDVEEVLGTLLNALKSPNFKVRISAAQALTVIQYRNLYGSLFPKVWLQLLDALSSSATDVNFKEIKHQENLSDQICYSICQLATLISLEDLTIITQETLDVSEVLFTSMWKFGGRTSSDKFSTICIAIENLDVLSMNDDDYVKQFTSVLKDILNQVTIAFYDQDAR